VTFPLPENVRYIILCDVSFNYVYLLNATLHLWYQSGRSLESMDLCACLAFVVSS